MKNITILGSTGSIGRNTLKVIESFPDRFKVIGLAAGKNIDLLIQQIEQFKPEAVSLVNENLARLLENRLDKKKDLPKIYHGTDGLVKVATLEKVNLVVSAIVGAYGLVPTMAAIEADKDVALANKEVLVMAGELIMKTAKKREVKILPIDSEHSAIFQILEGQKKSEVSKLILTASGGPFYEMSNDKLEDISVEEALAHPTWKMGRKITIDSATLMNKGLEVIEAHWLFGIDLKKIEVVVHPQSIIHSFVEFIDGSLLAQLGVADMRLPILYALNYPDRVPYNQLPSFSLTKVENLTFYEPRYNDFPCLSLAYQAATSGGTMPVVLNAANEIAVKSFLCKQIGFMEIPKLIKKTMKKHNHTDVLCLDDILKIDYWAREMTESLIT
ncbi:MAG: 1-deoxy-D-xylulose-5-phosphate reductoisomerase [bacterium]